MTIPSDQPGEESLWGSQRKMMEEMLRPWSAFAASAQSPGGTDLAEQMRAFLGNASAVAQATTKPLEDFLSAQRQFAEQMEQWASLQKALAEQTMALAKNQREIVEAVERWTAPFRGFPPPEDSSEPS